ncbi:Acyl-CoA desaturase [Operophtera brumata]|uniref:Acyl-CoA desaturase n=1 Tax=Operophtera brumata TaxID=104452 RepID=A0A0L7LAT3_OPEBR|nr:Acyl-CoA desaturase [Operophtera brumata]
MCDVEFPRGKASAVVPQVVEVVDLCCVVSQTSVLRFVRNHRLHHKYSDTDADPHNAGRGMFFSHIGWIMMKKNAEAVSKGKQIDDSDITSDPLLMWHERHLAVVNLVLCFVLPTWFNVWAWDESWACAIAWQCFVRYLVVLHSGMKNFLVSVATLGEGFHNYHHAFPFDYKATDVFFTINTATLLIKGWEKLGMATPKMIENMAERLGDGFRLKEEFDAE